jgi:SAM-dependent methyltransferase
VTSDCQPWPAGGTLAVCGICRLVQTVVEPRWVSEIKDIYARYSIYHQSGGVEQSVFAAQDGAARLRSDVIARALVEHQELPKTGRLLDLGCGNGAFLRAASVVLPGWSFYGSEWDEKYLDVTRKIPGFQQLFTGDWEDIPGTFDVISLVHVLEHIPSPAEALAKVRKRLSPGGLLLIEVPNCVQNPYMLLIADHCSHFSVNGLAAIVSSAGFDVLHATDHWVQKEITVVARHTGTESSGPCLLPKGDAERILGNVKLLDSLAAQAKQAAERGSFGIFGTSIAATWLDTQLGGATDFFVDEDPNRSGGRHRERPIHAPQDIPRGATVFVALPAPLCEQVAERIRRPDITVVQPLLKV